MLKSFVRVTLLGVATLVAAGPAGAGPAHPERLLKGDYAFSGTSTCLVSRGGFNANLTPAGPPAPFPFTTSFSVLGVRTFNGDGTGQVVGRVVTLTHPYALPPSVNNPSAFFNRGGASSSDVAATFTYAVGPGRTVTIDNVLFTGTVLTGPSAGQTFTVAGFPQIVGDISQDFREIAVAHEDPAVETITFSGGDVQERICHRARILLEQKGGRGDD